MTVWFTSDTHFNHEPVLQFQHERAKRWNSVEQMNAALLDTINSYVQPKDLLYHLGDFAWGTAKDVARLRSKIKCKRIEICVGNHDSRAKLEKVFGKAQTHDILCRKVEGKAVVMCHYPFLRWPASHYGSYHLFGHTHDKIKPDEYTLAMDVGVDANQLFPVSWDQVQSYMDFRHAFQRMMVEGKRPEGKYIGSGDHLRK